MSDTVPQIERIDASQAAHEVTANNLFDAASVATAYGRHAEACAGLNWGYYGARFGGAPIANGANLCGATTATYMVAHLTTGAVSFATTLTNWNNKATYGRCFKIITGAIAVTSYEDHRFGPLGILGAGAGATFSGGTLLSALNEAVPVTLASAATLNIGAAAANSIDVTGVTTITAFDAIAAGAVRRLVFGAALTLTHNAASLILPSGANIVTAAGDVAFFMSLGAGNWRCLTYQRSSGGALVAPALEAKIFDVKAYGCIGNGTTDDTANFSSAVAALNAAGGGVLLIPAGFYLTSGGFSFTTRVTIIGRGSADHAGLNPVSQVLCNSPTANLFTFTVNGSTMTDFDLKNTAATLPTAGAGLLITNGGGAKTSRVTVNRFWNNIVHTNSTEWSINQCLSYGFLNYGIWINNTALPDGGDWHLSDTEVIANGNAPQAGIFIESGGGGRINGCKTNVRSGTLVNGLLINVAAGTNTVLLQVANSSFENSIGSAIKAVCVATRSFTQLMFIGCNTGFYGTTDQIGIEIVAGAVGQLDRVVIDGGLFTTIAASTKPAISLTNVNLATIGPCMAVFHPSLLALIGCTNVKNLNPTVTALTDGVTVTPDIGLGTDFRWTLAGNRTLANPLNLASGQPLNIRIIQDATGSRLITFGTAYKFPGGAIPALSTAAGAKDLLCCQYDATDGTLMCVLNKAFA